MERHCTIGTQRLGRAWVLPHPERATPGIAPMVRDEEIERIAVREAIAHEESRWVIESVETGIAATTSRRSLIRVSLVSHGSPVHRGQRPGCVGEVRCPRTNTYGTASC